MTATDPFESPNEGEVRRTKDGRPYIFNFEKGKEVAYARVTSYIDVLDDKFMLHQWSTRGVVKGIHGSDELQYDLSVAVGHEDETKLLNQLAERALEAAGAHEAREIGTELHRLTEDFDRNERWGSLPAVCWNAHREDLVAYVEALKRHRLVPVEIEVFVANDHFRAAGTFDRIFEWYRDGWDSPPLRVIGDLKTGRVDYGQGKLAMQLALYANSSLYDPANPQAREPHGASLDTGLIVHLPQGEATCKVYEVDLRLSLEGIFLAQQVRDWRRRTRSGVLNDLDLEL